MTCWMPFLASLWCDSNRHYSTIQTNIITSLLSYIYNTNRACIATYNQLCTEIFEVPFRAHHRKSFHHINHDNMPSVRRGGGWRWCGDSRRGHPLHRETGNHQWVMLFIDNNLEWAPFVCYWLPSETFCDSFQDPCVGYWASGATSSWGLCNAKRRFCRISNPPVTHSQWSLSVPSQWHNSFCNWYGFTISMRYALSFALSWRGCLLSRASRRSNSRISAFPPKVWLWFAHSLCLVCTWNRGIGRWALGVAWEFLSSDQAKVQTGGRIWAVFFPKGKPSIQQLGRA